MGGKPSKGTSKDKRLKENKPKPVSKPIKPKQHLAYGFCSDGEHSQQISYLEKHPRHDQGGTSMVPSVYFQVII